MKSLRYLNVVLTLIAVLLTMNLWVQYAQSPVGIATPALAAAEEGLANPAAQRNEIIALLKKQVAATENLHALLKSGTLKVKVDAETKK
jgi:hypothetical protein